MNNLKKAILSILLISLSLFGMDAPGIKTCCSTVGDKPYFSVILEKIKSLSENKELSDSARIDEINKNLNLICSNLEKSKDETDSKYMERIKLCMVAQYVNSLNSLENQETHSLSESTKTIVNATIIVEETFDRVNIGQIITFQNDKCLYSGRAKNDIERGRIDIKLESQTCITEKNVNTSKIDGYVVDTDNKIGLAADETFEDKFYKATIKAGKKVQLVIKI